ncbi:MAG: type 2 isopentenyl-diphosphate Delta-isomerase [Bradymonadia bacterium]
MADIFQRKRDHIALSHTGDVGHGQHRGLFEHVHLVHQAIPELSMDALDLTTPFGHRELSAPLMLTGMTGGPPEAGDINRDLARICDALGLAFGVGSQRVMTRADVATPTFQVRSHAPNVVLLGNVGINQARDMGTQAVKDLMEAIEADFMAIHLNPAMELVQPGADADRDFREGYDTLGRLMEALDGHIVVKECGSGISPAVMSRLVSLGVPLVDVSGSGGTSWVKVEALRAQGPLADLGLTFADWGIPTAAAVALAADARAQVSASKTQIIASGGIANGLTATKALALGADIAGMARPALQAYMDHGVEGATTFLKTVISGVRMGMALTGSRRPEEVRTASKIITGDLQAWVQQGRLG